MILFRVLIILGIAALAKWLCSAGKLGGSAGMRALEILKERYARGEITRDEYQPARRDLEP